MDAQKDRSCDTATGEEYGLLAEIIGDAEYTHITNLYDSAITTATVTHTRKRMEENWEENTNRVSFGKVSSSSLSSSLSFVVIVLF